MSCCGCCSCNVCKSFKILVAIVVTLTTIAAIIGVWKTHFLSTGLSFGSMAASLSLIALVYSITTWRKITNRLCPNREEGACCSKK